LHCPRRRGNRSGRLTLWRGSWGSAGQARGVPTAGGETTFGGNLDPTKWRPFSFSGTRIQCFPSEVVFNKFSDRIKQTRPRRGRGSTPGPAGGGWAPRSWRRRRWSSGGRASAPPMAKRRPVRPVAAAAPHRSTSVSTDPRGLSWNLKASRDLLAVPAFILHFIGIYLVPKKE